MQNQIFEKTHVINQEKNQHKLNFELKIVQLNHRKLSVFIGFWAKIYVSNQKQILLHFNLGITQQNYKKSSSYVRSWGKNICNISRKVSILSSKILH